jgi:GNAT superfamily N-acetyltransferase
MPHFVPFADSFVPEAAALLAARYRQERSHAPALVARFAAVTAAQEVVQALWTQEGTSGVVALQGSHLVGYVLGQVIRPAPASLAALFLQPRSLVMPYAGHALAPESPADLYRALYAAAAPSWLAAGCFFHVISLPACDQMGQASWFSLGFGQRDVFAVRETTPRVPAAPGALGVHCRRGGATDQAAVRRLLTDLYRSSAGAPSWVPFLPDAVTGILAEQERMLNDPGRAYWLACHSDQALGLHVVNLPDYPPSVWDIGGPGPVPHVDMAVTAPAARGQGIGTALLNTVLAAAYAADQPWCTVAWQTTNLLADRFWRRQGFRPLHTQLARSIDPRIRHHGPPHI